MNILIIANDAPYGIERTYNALRIAGALSREEEGDLIAGARRSTL